MQRINNVLKYSTEHDGGFGVSVTVVWHVRWSAAVQFKPGTTLIEDIQHEGMPTVYSIEVALAGSKCPVIIYSDVNEAMKLVWVKITAKPYMVAEIDSEIVHQIHTLAEAQREAA